MAAAFALLLALWPLAAALPAQQRTATEACVRYRSAETVYLDAGSAAGIAVGDRFEVRRDGRVVAEVEVIFTAERSASARVLREREPIQPGDRARRIGAATTPPPAPAQRAPSTQPPTTPPPPPSEAAAAEADRYGERVSRAAERRVRSTRASGTLTFEWRGTSGGGSDEASRDATRSLARLQPARARHRRHAAAAAPARPPASTSRARGRAPACRQTRAATGSTRRP